MATRESLTGHVTSVYNLVVICTEVVSGGANCKHLIGEVLHEL